MYECDLGYEIDGMAERVCELDGRVAGWSGEAPTCQGEWRRRETSRGREGRGGDSYVYSGPEHTSPSPVRRLSSAHPSMCASL